MADERIERDSLGEVRVPADKLWGAQTQRAVENFQISSRTLPNSFIETLLHIKWSAAEVNGALKQIEPAIAHAIAEACQFLLDSKDFATHFPIDVFQTGSGTSTNMNANEVIARLASTRSGLNIHPNDHVNYGQSSNDVIPTAISISAAIGIRDRLLPALRHLRDAINAKAARESEAHGGDIVKTGRTHLMDAVPITMQQAMSGWSTQVDHNIQLLTMTTPYHQQLAQGGTALGTGLNTHPNFAAAFCKNISARLELTFQPADNFFAAIASQDHSVQLSGQLKTCATSFMKIANDLRWMNSGPLSGLGEIALEPLQAGSSIMPGKVNPVIPEAVTMAAAQVFGNDTAITCGGQSGNFELNVMLPMIASNLLESIDLLTNSAWALADQAIATFTVNHEHLSQTLALNPILVTALNPILGYAHTAEIAKKAYATKRPIIDVAEEDSELDRATLEQLLNPANLTHPQQR